MEEKNDSLTGQQGSASSLSEKKKQNKETKRIEKEKAYAENYLLSSQQGLASSSFTLFV